MKRIIDIDDEWFESIIASKDHIDKDDEAYLILNSTPYEERPQSKWIVTAEDNDGVHRICCPFCSYEKGSNNTDPIIVTFTDFPKFCENCGADMRKGDTDCMDEDAKQASIPYTYNAPQHDWKCGYPDITRGKGGAE